MDDRLKLTIFALVLLFLLGLGVGTLVPRASAHNSVIGNPNTKETSYLNPDFHVSKVWYLEETFEGREYWITFETAEELEPLIISVGVPVIQDQRDSKPRLDIYVNNELKNTYTNSEKSEEDCNMIEIHHRAVQNGKFIGFEPVPCKFYEPFSQTYSWITTQILLDLEDNSVYHVKLSFDYVLQEDMSPQYKAWVAIGEDEDFGPEQLLDFQQTVPYIAEFHETTQVGQTLYGIAIIFVLIVALGFSRVLIKQGKRRK
tara:strand:- start:595 stop:1368 length:774 start_codon:yes stop_codon:yes gene_type:complete